MGDVRMIPIAELQKKFPTDPPSVKWIRQEAVRTRMGCSYGRHFLVREDLYDHCQRVREISAKRIIEVVTGAHDNTRGHIYFVQCGEFIKIGFATNVEQRLLSLRASNPYEIVLIGSIPGTIAGERAIHALVAKYHHQYEWFDADPKLISVLEEVCNYEK